MPKKSRRAKARRRARIASMAPEHAVAQLARVPGGLQSTTRASSEAQDLTGRYQYVILELKRIGIIAGAMILVIIILSFVLPFLRG